MGARAGDEGALSREDADKKLTLHKNTDKHQHQSQHTGEPLSSEMLNS